MHDFYQHTRWVSLSHSKSRFLTGKDAAPKTLMVAALSLLLTLCGTVHAQVPVFADGFETCNVSLSPESIDFGDVVQGSTGPARVLKIGNVGNEPINITGLSRAPGTSSQFKFSSVPSLPANVDPAAEQAVSLQLQGQTGGSIDGAMLVNNDTFGCPELAVPVSGRVLACAGDQGGDVGSTCPTGKNIGRLSDCGDGNTNKSVSRDGTLRGPDDEDLYYLYAEDQSRLGCDNFTDSFGIKVELIGETDGVTFCYRHGAGGCGGVSGRSCGHTSKTFAVGSYGSNDSTWVTIWVEWDSATAPKCGSYELKVRADAG